MRYIYDSQTKSKIPSAGMMNPNIIAPLEPTTVSKRSYLVGDQLIWNDELYTVTQAISVNDMLAVGTNITASDSIVEQIAENTSDISSLNEALTNEVTTRVTSGAHNFAPITNVTQEIHGVTFTVSDTVKISGTVSTGQYVSFRLTEKHPIDVSLKGKECKLHYDNSKGAMLYMWIEGYDSSNTKVLDKTILYNALDTTFTIPSSTETITIAITVLYSYDGALFDVQPMLILASDPSPAVFTPYAKSNKELTERIKRTKITATLASGSKILSIDTNLSSGEIPISCIPVFDTNYNDLIALGITSPLAYTSSNDDAINFYLHVETAAASAITCTFFVTYYKV